MNTTSSFSEIPSEPIVILSEDEALKGIGSVKVTPKVNIHGTTFTIKLKVEITPMSDTKTFTLSQLNNWKDTKEYFSWPTKTQVTIEAQRTQKRVHIRVDPPAFKAIDKYIPFSVVELPGDFANWSPHGGEQLEDLRKIIASAKKVDKSANMIVTEDHQGVEERCTFLGQPDYSQKVFEALGSGSQDVLTGADGSIWLFAVGAIADASAYVGFSGLSGFWWTDTEKCGLYGGFGAQAGAIAGANLHAVYTIVRSLNGKSALENFKDFHIARGVVGEGMTFSLALLGDLTEMDIFGIMYGLGVGGGAPAGGYAGAVRQALLEF